MFTVNYLIKMNAQFHSCNLADNTEEAKSTMGIRNFTISHVRNRENIGFNQSLIYISPFPPTPSPNFLNLPLFNSGAKKL
jgi:hypothetical protein